MATVITYRSKHDIRREILALLSTGARIKTHIMYEAKLSYPQLQTYMADLIGSGLVKEQAGAYIITAQGKEKLALLTEALA